MTRSDRFRRSLTLATFALGAAGCSHPAVGPTGGDALRTDRTEYVADRSGGGVALEIALTFTNPTGGPVNIPSCHEPYAPLLEKLVGDAWVTAYAPPQLLCLGVPVVVPAGGTLPYRFRIEGFPRGSNSFPQFEVQDVPGTYRLVWHIFEGDGSGYATGGPAAELPLEQRVSNTFRITE